MLKEGRMTMSRWMVLACLSAMFAAGAPALSAVPDNVAAAVADSRRPDADRKLDPERKPADMLMLAHIRPGERVMDMIPGGGYFTRLFAVAVGPKGYVYAYQPTEWDNFHKGKPAAVLAVAPDYPNVSVIDAPINKLVAPEPLDVVWTSQNYHDLHNDMAKPADLAVINKAVFDALKPGGLYVVLDHAAENGSGLRDTQKLHRIDEAVVKTEVEAAGFKLAAESNVLRNPGDPRTALVFDSSIRHKTDQFILVFRKPGGKR
jgi:predicted methyltransferase